MNNSDCLDGKIDAKTTINFSNASYSSENYKEALEVDNILRQEMFRQINPPRIKTPHRRAIFELTNHALTEKVPIKSSRRSLTELNHLLRRQEVESLSESIASPIRPIANHSKSFRQSTQTPSQMKSMRFNTPVNPNTPLPNHFYPNRSKKPEISRSSTFITSDNTNNDPFVNTAVKQPDSSKLLKFYKQSQTTKTSRPDSSSRYHMTLAPAGPEVLLRRRIHGPIQLSIYTQPRPLITGLTAYLHSSQRANESIRNFVKSSPMKLSPRKIPVYRPETVIPYE